MDYSLLLCIERKFAEKDQPDLSFEKNSSMSKSNQDSKVSVSRHQIDSVCGQFTYHLAVIDYLQNWNRNKKCESFLKTVFKGESRNEISCVPPSIYQSRFMRFV